jgi:ElaB/YqjD/DUF883 family membrane-anchored ribosome-binding protein
MDHRLERGVKNAAGKVGEAVGDLASELKSEAGSRAQRMAGQAADEVRDLASGYPLSSMLAAAGVGLLAGMVLARRL